MDYRLRVCWLIIRWKTYRINLLAKKFNYCFVHKKMSWAEASKQADDYENEALSNYPNAMRILKGREK